MSVTSDSSRASASKWESVLREIEQQFDAGQYEAGQSFYTLGQLARRFGVSDITARRVFQELKGRGRIVTRGSRGTFVAPRRQRQVVYMCLRSGSAGEMGGIAEDSLFYRNFLAVFHRDGLDQGFEVKPLSVDFCLRNLDVVAGAPVLVALEAVLKIEGGDPQERRVFVDDERLALLRRRAKVIVFRSLPGILDGVSQVSRDLREGFQEVVRHLVGRGHTRLAMLCGNLSNVWFKPRFEGYLDALSQAGLACDPRLVEITYGTDAAEDAAAVERLLAHDSPPTAIVCANDARALHVLEHCRSRGIRVPEDLAITGFDNTLEASLSSPALTTLDGCTAEVVRAMFPMVERMMSNAGSAPEQIVVTPRLVVRESS